MTTDDARELAHTLFEEIGDAAFVVDLASLRLLDVNPMSQRLTGMPREQLLQTTLNELFRSDVDRELQHVQRALHTMRTFQSQEGYFLHRPIDDSWVPVNLTLTRLHTERKPLGLVLARDVSDRHRVEESLRLANAALERRVQERTADLARLNEALSQEIAKHLRAAQALKAEEGRFRAFMDHSPAAAWIADTDGRMIFVSAAFRRLFRLPPGDPVGRRIFELFPPAIADVRLANIREVAMSGKPKETTEPGVRADGSAGEFIFYRFPLPTSDRSLIGGVAIDVTERKLAERAFLESKAVHERLVNSLDLVVWEADPETFRFTFVSPQAESLLGFPVARWLEPDFWQSRIHEDDRERSVRFCRDQCARRLDHEFEYRMIAADGRVVWVLDKVRFAAAGNETVRLAGTMQDISADKSAAQRHQHLEEQLRQAQKMEAVGRLAGGIAHDFNNLLTVINGHSELLLTKLKVDEPLRESVREVFKAGERAGTLTRQLLAFSRQQVLEPRVLNLNAVIEDTERMLRRLIGEDVVLSVSLASGLGRIRADLGQIEQILINLAVNARDAMPKGGRLTIETSNVLLDETFCREVTDVRPGRYVLLAVGDTGTGMDAATRERIFEPFFTTKDVGKGTGLGLATVHGIIKQSGGHIAVDSQLGRGSTFQVYLPIVDDVEISSKSLAKFQRLPPGTETVLLAEDEDAVRALSRIILQRCGYQVLEAVDGEAALTAARQHGGPIHLLVSDVVMPHLGGGELAERLRATRPAVKVLFLSGYTDDAVVRHGVLEAEFAFLQKPFTPTQLAQKVREVLDGVE